MDNNNKKAKRRYGGAVANKRQNAPKPHTTGGRIRKARSGSSRAARAHSEDEDGASQGELVEYERQAGWSDADRYVLWPVWLAFVVYIVTLTSRVWIVSDKAHWWILHPDEVFQSLEVAHSEVYGYGFRPYEYLPLHTPGNERTSLADKQEAEMGMYSLRSWLYPRLYMLVFHIKDYVGGEQSPFLAGKIFHAVVAGHLPVSTFYFTNYMTRSHDIATSAAILVSFSEHLTVLGTHTLVNSFLSPLVFVALAALYALVVDDPIVGPNVGDSQDASSGESDTASSSSTSGTPTKDVNGNAKSPVIQTATDEKDMHVGGELEGSNGNLILENRTLKTDQSGVKSCFVIGTVLAVLCYVRVDIALFLVVIGVVFFTDMLIHPIKHGRTIGILIAGGIAGVVIGGLDDLHSYGIFMMSPFQWFRFNVLTDLPNLIFGLASEWTYVEFILNYDMLTRIQTVLQIITFLLVCYRLLFVETTLRNRQLDKCFLRLVLATVFLFLAYSLKGHKEIRFMHNVIVLFHISSALSFTILYRQLIDSVQSWYNTIKLHARMLFVLFAANLLLNFPNANDQSNQIWAYKGVTDSHHINECLDFIRQQPDVTGLFSDRSIHETAAYSVLHKDVPIFSLFHKEFMEFDKSARKNLPSNDYFSSRSSVGVTVTSQISNFISTENSPLLLKALVNEPHYNYLLLKTSRKLVSTGFEEVFRSGTMRVMRKTQNERGTEELQQIADSIPIGRNATILEYEGSWLMTYGLRQLAMERLEVAIELDVSRIRAFQLLSLIYRDMGRNQDARRVSAKCFKNNGKDACMKAQPQIVLHPEYPR